MVKLCTIKMWSQYLNWIHLAQDNVQWQTPCMQQWNLRLHKMRHFQLTDSLRRRTLLHRVRKSIGWVYADWQTGCTEMCVIRKDVGRSGDNETCINWENPVEETIRKHAKFDLCNKFPTFDKIFYKLGKTAGTKNNSHAISSRTIRHAVQW
jgi:hypothetical protein